MGAVSKEVCADAEYRTTASIRNLIPINELAPDDQDALIAQGTLREFSPGQILHVEDRSDEEIHFLLDGTVEYCWKGSSIKQLAAPSNGARRALAKPGRQRYTVVTETYCRVVTFSHTHFQNHVNNSRLRTVRVEVNDIYQESSSNWMIRLLQSKLFRAVPPANIQAVFARIESIRARAGDAIVRQGAPADYFYMIERGYCEVTRTIAAGHDIQLADLNAGDSFGEAAIISDCPRTATVTMLTDGTLMRLSAEDFDALILKPVLRARDLDTFPDGIGSDERWLDIRFPEQITTTRLNNSVNIPFSLLRLKSAQLSTGHNYILCGDDPGESAVGAFLLIERGFRASYLDASVTDLVQHYPELQAIDLDSTAKPNSEASAPTELEAPAHPARGVSNRGSQNALVCANSPTALASDPQIARNDAYCLEDASREVAKRDPGAAPDTEDEEWVVAPKKKPTPPSRDIVYDLPSDLAQAASSDAVEDAISSGGEDDFSIALPSAPPEFDTQPRAEDKLNAADDPITKMFVEIDDRLRAVVKSTIDQRISDIDLRHREKLRLLPIVTKREIDKRLLRARARRESEVLQKELKLRNFAENLASLANKIKGSKMRLEIVQAHYESRLEAADKAYRQVDELRVILGESLSEFPYK